MKLRTLAQTFSGLSLIVPLLASAAGCTAQAVENEPLQDTQEASTSYPARHVPIRFVLLKDAGSSSHPAEANDYKFLREAVQNVNHVWNKYNVTAGISRIQVVNTSMVYNVNRDQAIGTSAVYSFSQVETDLRAIYPDFVDNSGGATTNWANWLHVVASQMTEGEAVVFVSSAGSTGCAAPRPHQDGTSPGAVSGLPWANADFSASIYCEQDPAVLFHEFGHYLNLVHTFDIPRPPQPGEHQSLTREQLYDLIWTVNNGQIKTFASEAEASAATTSIYSKDFKVAKDTYLCSVDASTCDGECRFNNGGLDLTVDTSDYGGVDVNDPAHPLHGMVSRDSQGLLQWNPMAYQPFKCAGPASEAQGAVARAALDSSAGKRDLLGVSNPGFDLHDVPTTSLASGYAPVAQRAGRLELFARRSNNQLMRAAYDPQTKQTTSWTTVPGSPQIQGRPSVVSWGSGRLDLFVRATDNSVRHFWEWLDGNGTPHAGWESMGGSVTSSPAVTSDGSGRLRIFAAGQDSTIWTRSYNSGWTSWNRLSTQTISGDIGAVAWGSNRLDLFATLPNQGGQLGHFWQNGSASGWETMDIYATDPVVASSKSGRLDLFAVSFNYPVYRWYEGSWSSWMDLGGPSGLAGGVHASSDQVSFFLRSPSGQGEALVYDAPGAGCSSITPACFCEPGQRSDVPCTRYQ